MKRLLFILGLLVGISQAQTTTTITGTIKDLTQALVTSGKVTFTLQPSRDTTISGLARFSPAQVVCLINASGLIKAQDGTSVCTLTMNTALNPPGTYYRVDVWPFNVKTSSFTFYAVLSTYDWSTVVPTPATSPFQNFVDVISNQTIGGNKTFTGTLTLQGTVLASGPFTLSNPCAIDGLIYVSTGGCYTTVSSAKTALAGKSGVIVIPPGYTETFPTAITLGDGVTQSVYLHAYAPVTLTCNVSSGPCLTANDASAMDCVKGPSSLSSIPSLQTSCMLVLAATASVTDVVTTGTGLIDYFIDGWTISNLLGGTKSGALLHLAGGGGRNVASVSHMDLIWPTTGIGLLEDAGTVHLDTVEVEGDFSTGVRPCVIKPPTSTPIQDVRWTSVTCEHAGVGQRALEINGNGVTNGVQGFRCFGCRIEGTTSADATGQALIRDAVAVSFYSPYCATPGGNLSNPYCFEISQSGAGLTDDIAIYDAFNASPASTNLVTNLITSKALNKHQGNYRYGTSATGTVIDSGMSFVGPTPDINGNNVAQIVGSGTATSNGTAIATLTSQAQPAITITGATTTDVAICSLNVAPPATWQTGIQQLLPIVTANTVTLWLSNPTAGSITPAATAFRCTVTR